MKPFNLEEAKAGKPVCMRNGRAVRIICWDKAGDEYPIVALSPVTGSNCVDEAFYCYTVDGVYLTGVGKHEYDLVMVPVQRTVWVPLYRGSLGHTTLLTGSVYATLEQAELTCAGLPVIGIFPITYEE